MEYADCYPALNHALMAIHFICILDLASLQRQQSSTGSMARFAGPMTGFGSPARVINLPRWTIAPCATHRWASRRRPRNWRGHSGGLALSIGWRVSLTQTVPIFRGIAARSPEQPVLSTILSHHPSREYMRVERAGTIVPAPSTLRESSKNWLAVTPRSGSGGEAMPRSPELASR